MKYKPHSYQNHTTQFIETHSHAAIFLGMGMGKTVSTLTAINNLTNDRFTVNKTLIIAPLRVARDTWPTEITKWDHLKNLTYSVILGTPTQRQEALSTSADIYIINRENIPWLVNTCGKSWPFDMVIIDELSSFKNHKAQRFKALKKVRPHINRIIGLTGTPAPNSLIDLWAPFYLLDEGKRLGQYLTHYRDKYFLPDKRSNTQIFTWKLRNGADQEIYDTIADITVSMRTTDHLNLPSLTVTTHDIHLTPKNRETYNKLRDTMVTELNTGDIIDAGTAATLSNKLLQLSSGAIYTEDGDTITIHPQKTDALTDIIEAANGQTILVAYWFNHEVPRILEAVPEAQLLSTAEDFQAWNNKEIRVGLIHPASAGHGLNLQTGGHILVWFTTPWSLELYEQTNARLFRQGQTEPVTITHIITADTIDTQVIHALERKEVTQSALIEAVKAQL